MLDREDMAVALNSAKAPRCGVGIPEIDEF